MLIVPWILYEAKKIIVGTDLKKILCEQLIWLYEEIAVG